MKLNSFFIIGRRLFCASRNRRTGKFNCARAYRLNQVKPVFNSDL